MMSLWKNIAPRSRSAVFFASPSQDFFPLPAPLLEAFYAALYREPRLLLEAYSQLLPALFNVQQNTLHNLNGHPTYPIVNDPVMAKRFRHKDWHTTPYFYACHQNYMALATSLLKLTARLTMEGDVKKELLFYLEQWLGALSPANFPLTNPELFRKVFCEGSGPFEDGFEKLQKDWKKLGPERFFLNLTRPQGFEVGKNLATTPGQVVFKNDLCELIAYTPSTSTVYAKPLLIVPPWINKYYIFDLSQEHSFAAWLRDQGVMVFVLSWRSPPGVSKDLSFQNYLDEGVLRALETVRALTKADSVNTAGYCLGGNLLLCALATLEKQKKPWIASATFLATIFDFSQLESLGLFLKPHYTHPLKHAVRQQGVLDGRTLGMLFCFLRANDMIWPALVDRYFLKKAPLEMDVLYWNADTASLPATMYLQFLEAMVEKNGFLDPAGLTLGTQTFHFDKLTTPSFLVAAKSDHIAPWRSCYALFEALKGPRRFVLSTSGHIAGIINPPNKKKYSYFHRDYEVKSMTSDAWLHNAQPTNGSWWPAWMEWLQTYTGEKVAAKTVAAKWPNLGAAPGTYVLENSAPPKKDAPPKTEP